MGTVDDYDAASNEVPPPPPSLASSSPSLQYKVIYDYKSNYSWGSIDTFEIIQLPVLHNKNPEKVNKSTAGRQSQSTKGTALLVCDAILILNRRATTS